MSVLHQIMAERRADVAAARARVPEAFLRRAAAGRSPRGLGAALRARPPGRAAIIAEMKKASPSAGLLRPDYQPEVLGRLYAAHGAVGISVLTEPRHFIGSEADLCAVRAAVDLPILRKDFTTDPYQVLEAAAWGADVVLLIVAALDPETLRTLYAAARALGLDVLAEAHTAAELDRALALEEALIGVNSRDLITLRTDLAVARDLAGRIPRDRLAIAESGISRRQEIEELAALGYAGFLIGEAILAAPDPAAKLAELAGG